MQFEEVRKLFRVSGLIHYTISPAFEWCVLPVGYIVQAQAAPQGIHILQYTRHDNDSINIHRWLTERQDYTRHLEDLCTAASSSIPPRTYEHQYQRVSAEIIFVAITSAWTKPKQT